MEYHLFHCPKLTDLREQLNWINVYTFSRVKKKGGKKQKHEVVVDAFGIFLDAFINGSRCFCCSFYVDDDDIIVL